LVNDYEDFDTYTYRSSIGSKINIDKCFLITMESSKTRYNSFLKNYNQNCKLPLEIIWSVNTKNPEVAEQYKHLVTQEKYNLMYKFDSGKAIRPDHSYINSGALGCYLGRQFNSDWGEG